MAISFSTVTSGTGSGTSAVSAAFALSAGEVGWFAVFSYDTDGTGPSTPTITGWTQVLQCQAQVTPGFPVGCTVFRRVGAFASATQTISFGSSQGYILWQVVKCTGAKTSGTNASDAVRQTITGTTGTSWPNNITASFTTFTPTASGNAILSFHIDWNVNTITARTNFSALYNQADGNIATCATMARTTGTDTAVSHTSSGSAPQGIGGIEVAADATLSFLPSNGPNLPYSVMAR